MRKNSIFKMETMKPSETYKDKGIEPNFLLKVTHSYVKHTSNFFDVTEQITRIKRESKTQ